MTAILWEQIEWRDRKGRRVSIDLRDGKLRVRPWSRSLRDVVVWASGKSNDWISKILNATFNAAAITFPATVYAALWTAALSASSTGSTAGEAAYTGYARVAVTANTTNFPTSSGGAAITNGTAITFPANSGANETEVAFALLDAPTAGNVKYWGAIVSTVINTGNTPQVAAGALTVTEA